MFFFEKVVSIGPRDRVLEVGPGGTPHPRSDVMLELVMSESEAVAQRGNTPPLETTKPVVYYDGGDFPFADGEFDYVICTHVLEHVDDLERFLNELFRVAPKGYVEYPTVYYEYLHNFDVHVNLLRREGSTLYRMRKIDTLLDVFRPVQEMFLRAANVHAGYSVLLDDMRDVMFEGFEWHTPFRLVETKDLGRFTADPLSLEVTPLAFGQALARFVSRLRRQSLTALRPRGR